MRAIFRQNRIRIVLILLFVLLPQIAAAQQPVPKVSISVASAKNPHDVAVTLEILLLMTVLTLAPAILILMTSFTRIIVVFHFLRQALGLQQMPPNQVLIGLALFLTVFIMNPTFNRVYQGAVKPYMNEKISFEEAAHKAMQPMREFMLKQTREKDLTLLVDISGMKRPATAADVPTHVLIPAFVISELRIAFQIGFLIYIPFLVIDVVVASVLMSMGMLMLPPIMISLPFKILLFILTDGWNLLVTSVLQSFRM